MAFCNLNMRLSSVISLLLLSKLAAMFSVLTEDLGSPPDEEISSAARLSPRPLRTVQDLIVLSR